jgi:hypothetical protein
LVIPIHGCGFGDNHPFVGKRSLFKAGTFVEIRAVHDYGSFLKSVPFDLDTVNLIRDIITDEEVHIQNWKSVRVTMLE